MQNPVYGKVAKRGDERKNAIFVTRSWRKAEVVHTPYSKSLAEKILEREFPVLRFVLLNSRFYCQEHQHLFFWDNCNCHYQMTVIHTDFVGPV